MIPFISVEGAPPLKDVMGRISMPPPYKKGIVPLPGETPLPEVVRFSIIKTTPSTATRVAQKPYLCFPV
jgi:hypothetical protein